MNTIRKFSLILAMLLLLSVLQFELTAEEPIGDEIQVQTGDFIDENGDIKLISDTARSLTDDFSYTRVLLGTNSARNLTISLYGAYYIANTMRSAVGNTASPYVLNVSVSNGSVKLMNGSTTLITASTVTLNRVNLNEAGGYLKLTGCTGGLANDKCYLGNLRLSVNSDGSLRIVNIVPTAHYLYGIVPYEMTESWLPNALRAQAMACKSYAFAFPYGDADYDITDSMNYQGYRGYNPGYERCMQACLDVCGELLTFNSQIVLTFYGSTNGGETENPSNVFGTPALQDAYEIKLDDLDFNFASNRRETLSITYGQAPDNAKFQKLLEDEAKALLGTSVSVVSIDRAQATTPKFTGSSRNMTKLEVRVTVRSSGGSESTIDLAFDITKLKTYGIFTKSYKMYWGKRTTSGYEVYFCRYGHGLGLSQHGAQARALAGNDYHDILNFYFSKFDIVKIAERSPERPYDYTQEVLAYGEITGTSVNFRTGPSTNYASIEALPRNTHLDIIGEENGWLRCIANGKLGYIHGAYADISFFPSPEDGIFQYHSATLVSSCNAYDVPSTYGTISARFLGGERVTVRHTIGDYFYVTSSDGRKGFIIASNVNIRFYSLGCGFEDSMNIGKVSGKLLMP